MKAAKALKEKGETPEELLRSIKENEAVVAEAQRVVDAWKAIVGEKARREEAAKAEAERIATEKAEAERKAAEERERAEEERDRIEAELDAQKADEEARLEAERKAEEEAVEKDAELKEDKKKPQIKDVVKTIYEKGKAVASKLFGRSFFDVAKTPDFMKKLGLTGDRFTIKYGVLSRHAGKDASHLLTEKQWEELPDAIQKPFAITRFGEKENGYRLYTTMKNDKGETIVVGVDVKNIGRNLEVNSISTIFGRRGDAKITQKEEVLYTDEKITPEQRSLLGQPNSDQYTDTRERNVSADKGSKKAEKKQKKQSVFDKAKEIADKEEKKRKAEADKPKQKPLTEAERKDAEEVAGALGYRVEWVDTMAENGTIDADKKVIRIAKDAENPLVQVLGHEVAHGVKRMDGGKFKALQKAAMEVVGEKEWNERIEKKRKLNAYAEGKLAEEVTCDIVGEALNDKDALKRLAESLRGEKGILARLRDAVVRMVEYFKNRGDKDGVRRMKAADKLLAEFEGALKEGANERRLSPNTPIRLVNADADHGFKNYEEARAWAKENIARTYGNDETGGKGEIRISNTAIRKYLSESAVGKSESRDVHLAVLRVLPDVIRESVDVEQHADYLKGDDGKRGGNGVNPNVIVHRLYGCVDIDGKQYRVKVTVKEDMTASEPKIPHSYEATKIELLAGTLESSGISPFPSTSNSITAAKLLKGVKKSYSNEEFFANEGVDRSVRESRSEKTELTAAERELRDNLVERMRKGGLDVVTDSEEMQRVIDTENERTRNMFVGEKGATEADKAEEVSTRLDNLSVARRMEEAKKDAKTIKMATGWERGSDGKWRYETSDIKPKPFEEWMNKKNLKLGDIIDSDSGLFEMYPELKDFKVTRGKGKSTNAAIYTGLGKIEINFSKFKPYMSIPSNREKIDGILHRVINHEIQHAIQDSEGFAQGVSPNAFSPDAPIGKLREMEEADGRMVERYNAMSYTEKALGEGVRLKERILENRKEYNALASKYRFGMDGYTRAAGEVEARNTEKRIGMTEEERRASLASETEDVAREDQILLGVDNADGEMNTGSVREHRVYHGSGADFDAFDHSHMGEGEGAQAYGWGTYVTEVEGIGRTYAIQNTTKHNDALRALQHDVDAISDQLNRHRDDLKYDEEQLKRANEWRAEAELDYELFKDEAEELKEKYGESSPEYRNHLFNDIYTDEMKRAQSSVKSTEESIQYRKEKIAELEKALKDKQAEIDELPKEFPRHLYTVEIPDDNGSNYLDWNGHPAESLLKDVGSFLESEGFERVQDSPVRYEKGESSVVLNPNATGADLYAELREALGSDKKASQALAELGCIGIKYPADNMRGGREDGAKNYVIFNENDAKITDHVRFLRTAGGEVYGLVKDGRIYLDPKVATAETAVHEYTHLWGDMLRRKDSEQWSHTVKELKNSVLWEEVKELYPELKTDDEIADEVLSTFSGRRGAERLREEARRVADGDGGVFTKAKAIETLERVKEAIARFWEGVARMFGINRYRSTEELADMAMRDLLDSKNPMKDESGMRKRGEVGETLATSGTYFSGGGLLEAGLKGVIDPKVAVEFSEKIAGVYADNHGNHIVVADVRDVDPKKLVGAVDGGEVQYFHASPVCKNFSKAKREGGEVELDKETALSTAEFIAKTRPKVVTIENVKGYRNSEALKIITDELTRQGYDWDADVYNAADYGGYTKRERLIVRAKRDGKLPPKPEKLPEELRKKGWYSAVEDLIPHLEEKKTGVPQGTDERLKNSGIDYRTIDKPLYVFGRGYANKTVGHAFADELLPTLTTGGGDIIIMPDGRVLKASPRVLARVTGLPDTYKMPETDQLSHTIVGNGIPTQLTEGVIAPLLDNAIPSAERATKRESVFDVADRVSQNLEERTRAMRSDEIDRKYPNWLDGTTTDSGRHSTQVEGTRRTYNKVGDWIEKNIGKDVKILDASSGLGYGTADLKKRGFNIEDVEPYQSEERKKNNPATYSSYDDIPKDYDVIISNAVLNVIPDNWRRDVLHNMADHLKPGGIMFINTRKAGEERSIKDKIELDSPQEVLVKRNGKIASYQRFFAPKELKEWVEKELGNGYEVETANDNNSGTKGLAAVVVKKTDADIDRSVREFNPIELSNEDRQKRGDALRGAEPIDVKIKQIVKTKDMSARKAAEKWWKDNVGASRFYDTEIGLVEINKASVGSSLAHRYSQVKLDAITSLADGFNNAVYLGSMPDFSRQEGVKSHYFAYPINYNGHRNYVFCRAMQDANKNRLYVHEVFLADNIEKGNTLQTAASQPHGGITLYKDILANVLTANVTNNFETSKPRYSRKPGESIFDYASRVSEDVDRSVREIVSARDEYEKKVKSKGFQTKEALQNSMLGLQEFMSAIDHASGNKRYIEDIPDFENPILGENRLSSVNKEESHSRLDAAHSPTPTKGVRKPYLRSYTMIYCLLPTYSFLECIRLLTVLWRSGYSIWRLSFKQMKQNFSSEIFLWRESQRHKNPNLGDADCESYADGDAEGIETTMELLCTDYYGQDNTDVLRRFLQPVQQPRKGMEYHSFQGFRCTS